MRTDAHAPEVVSIGLSLLAVELASRAALHGARPDLATYAAHLPLDGTDPVYAYTCDVGRDGSAAGTDLQARMFAPVDGLVKDSATGSAAAAVMALLAALRGVPELALRVGQGVDMERPSPLLARARADIKGSVTALVGGRCVEAMQSCFACP